MGNSRRRHSPPLDARSRPASMCVLRENRDLDPRHQTTWTCGRNQQLPLPAGERSTDTHIPTTISLAYDGMLCSVGVDANLPYHGAAVAPKKRLDD